MRGTEEDRDSKKNKNTQREKEQRTQQQNHVWTVQKSSFGKYESINSLLNNLLRPWDISLVESVPKVLSLVGVSLGVWLKSPSESAVLLELFTLLLFSLSTSSSSSIVHWRARLSTAES